MHPKVSVIIPTYNSEKYIAKAIESVLQQTQPHLEVIVVDDASTDITVEIVQQYKSDRVKLLINDCNRGPSYTRNRGIKVAQGEWIALLDSDDWYAPERIEKLLQIARVEDADIIVDDLYLITDGAEKPWSTRFSTKLGFGWQPASFNKITQISVVDFIAMDLGIVKPMFKRNFLIQQNLQFDENLRFGEDFQLCLRSLICKAKFIVVPQPYYFYCSRPDSLITDYIKCQQQMHAEILRLLQEDGVKNHSILARSLTRRANILAIHLSISLAYNRVKAMLKSENFFIAIAKILTEPKLVLLSVLHVLRNLKQRAALILSTIPR